MTTENAEAQANQITIEVTRKGLEVTGALGRGSWSEIRTLVGQALAEIRGKDAAHQAGGKVSPQDLEKMARGQRDSVDLTDTRVARQVERELRRDGVTYAVTRDGDGRRIHIAAGNAAQLDRAMQRAERGVARRIERGQGRAETMSRVKAELRRRMDELPKRATVAPVSSRTRGRDGRGR